MFKRFFAVVLLVFFAGHAQSQSVKLSGAEIDELLAGNTAVGSWLGADYRQYFAPDGSTIFAQDGARSALGRWRVNAEKAEYQSIWPGDTDWERWFVMAYSGTYFWVSKSTPPTPFDVVLGPQLVAN